MPPQDLRDERDNDPDIPFEDLWQQRQQTIDRTLARLKRRGRSRRGDSQQSLRRSQREIRQLQQHFSTLKTEIEDYALGWQNLSKPFWLAVRFGGLGIIIGWVLCWSYLGGTRQERRSPQTRSAPAETLVSTDIDRL